MVLTVAERHRFSPRTPGGPTCLVHVPRSFPNRRANLPVWENSGKTQYLVAFGSESIVSCPGSIFTCGFRTCPLKYVINFSCAIKCNKASIVWKESKLLMNKLFILQFGPTEKF